MEINPVFKEIKKLKKSLMLSGNKGNGDLRERFYPAKLPSCEKKLKGRSEHNMVVHSFNPSTPEAEAGGPLSLRSAWSIQKVSGLPSKGNEGNHPKQKTSEDVTE